MADATTTAPYTAPPDFQGRQNLINTAYNTALARLGSQQSQLYGQYGYQDGTTNLDPNNQYGSIQQLLHQTGQSLTADDEAEEGRGLGLDSGLGAQRSRLINYAAGAQKNTLGQAFTTSLTGIGNDRTDAAATYNTDSLSNSNDQANYNSQMSAYAQAQAAYNQLIAGQAAAPSGPYLPGGGVAGSTPSPAASAGPREYIPPAKAKPGKVTIAKTGGHGNV